MLITHKNANFKNIHYGFFTKEVSLPKGFSEEQKKKLAQKFFDSENLSILEQKHTNEVVIIQNFEDSKCIADAQITRNKNIPLVVITADCVPIIFIDEINNVVATVHAGWRGAKKNIMKATVNKMREFGADKITAITGPCIKQRSYEVDKEFYNNFTHDAASNMKFFIPAERERHYLFDLSGYVKDKLSELDLCNILDINRNTYEEEDNFFSFRRTTHNPQSPMGNNISFVKII